MQFHPLKLLTQNVRGVPLIPHKPPSHAYIKSCLTPSKFPGCQKNFRCRYTTATAMLQELLSGLADQSLEAKPKRFLAPEMLLIDEVGFDRLEQHDAKNANLFHKVIDGCYCKGSTIVTTNIDFEALGDYLGDPVITAATVDRMVHHSIIINIEGPSWPPAARVATAKRQAVAPPLKT